VSTDSVAGRLDRLRDELEEDRHWILLGKLVSGLVHEINNPLDGVINSVRLIRQGKLGRERELEYLSLVEQELFRIASLTKRLLGLSRERPLDRRPTDLNELVLKALFFVDYRMTLAKVRLNRELAPALPPVQADAAAITQVVVNLFLNAIESMPEGGELTVRTEAGAEFVRVLVGDTGCGIPDEHLRRIFDPFFTTKPGTGTGLGLSICLNVVERHNGRLEVESAPGKGSIFTVSLPRGKGEAGGVKREE
jgi:signal transduction histidine kinase